MKVFNERQSSGSANQGELGFNEGITKEVMKDASRKGEHQSDYETKFASHISSTWVHLVRGYNRAPLIRTNFTCWDL